MENTFFFFALEFTAKVSGKQLVNMIKSKDRRSASLPNLIFHGPTKNLWTDPAG